jgi:hypothetical protein
MHEQVKFSTFKAHFDDLLFKALCEDKGRDFLMKNSLLKIWFLNATFFVTNCYKSLAKLSNDSCQRLVTTYNKKKLMSSHFVTTCNKETGN